MSEPIVKPCLSRKRNRPRDETGPCIICNEECDENKSNLSLPAWERLQEKTKDWKGLAKFGTVHETVDWQVGPQGVFFHKRCRAALASQRSLDQATRQKEEENGQMQETEADPAQQLEQQQEQQPGPSRCSRSKGPIRDKNLCVWCMKAADKKHSKPLCLIQQENA